METKRSRYPLDKNFLETKGFRPEIQGLRALAVFLVVIYHIWFGRVSGGVDVFLFISAFLLSLSSIRKINEGKPLAPVKYWLHVFQRLLPAASVVILATTIASFFIYAPSRLMGIVQDAFATIFYHMNWHLAFSSVDYYANNAAAKTPFQHFWSLSMQGQIFLTWPLLFLLVAFLARKLRFNLIGSAVLVFGVVWTASLTFSVIETYSNQGFAYFDTRTRLWEFASGTLLAILTFKWAPPQKLRVLMGWIGVLGLATCGLLLPVQQAFPGYLALVPLLSGAFVILAGRTESPVGVDRLLTSKPLLKLGESSYALYLVHWPLFILYAASQNKEQVNFLEGSALILVSMVLAYLLHTFVEQPLRKLEKKKTPKRRAQGVPVRNLKPKAGFLIPLTTIAVCLALVATPLGFARQYVMQNEAENSNLSLQAGSELFPGALAVGTSSQQLLNDPIPNGPIEEQFDEFSHRCDGTIGVSNSELFDNCTFDTYGDKDAPLTLLVGSSHTGQIVSVFRGIGEKTKTNMQEIHLGGCRFPIEPNLTPECEAFIKNAQAEVLKIKPETVVVMATVTDPATNNEVIQPGITDSITAFTKAGITVIAVRDNPRWTFNAYECAQLNQKNAAEECGAPVSEKMAKTDPAASVINKNPRVYGLDLTDVYCPDGYCAPIIGNIYVYMDDNHISKTYGGTTSEAAYKELTSEGWVPGKSTTSSPSPSASKSTSATPKPSSSASSRSANPTSSASATARQSSSRATATPIR